MDSLVFRCPGCQQPFQVLAEQAGQIVRCPSCADTVQIPATTAAPAAPTPQREGASLKGASPQTREAKVQPNTSAETKAEEVQAYGCPSCEKPFGIYPSMFGSEMACPHCQQTIQVQPKADSLVDSSVEKTAKSSKAAASSAAKAKRKPQPKQPRISPVAGTKVESPAAPTNPTAKKTELERTDPPNDPPFVVFTPRPVDHLLPPKFSAVDPAFFYRRHQDGSQVLLPSGDGSMKVVDNRIVRIEHNGQTYELISSPRYERVQRMIVTNVLAVIICGLVIAIVMTLLNG